MSILNYIIKYKYHIVILLIILLLILLLTKYYREYSEKFIDIEFISNSDGSSDSNNNGKININFKCMIDNKIYYLCNGNLSNCSDKLNNCNNNVLILIEENELLNKYKQYIIDIDIKQKVCKYENKLRCDVGENDKCMIDNNICSITTQFIHDFNIVKPYGRDNEYFIMGKIDDKDTVLNSFLYNNHNNNENLYICGDYDITNDRSNEYIEIINNNDNTYLLAFKKQKINRNTNIPMFDNDNKPIYTMLYLAKCVGENSKCGDNLRICLVENKDDANVLNFNIDKSNLINNINLNDINKNDDNENNNDNKNDNI